MASYISSNQNRLYCALETTYGQVPNISAVNRISAVKLSTGQELDLAARKDKTGSRTFSGNPAGGRKKTSFDLKTYMTSWAGGSNGPSSGPLFQAALGAAALATAGGTVSNVANGTQIGFSSPHRLAPNQGVAFNGEIRFVAAVLDPSTVILNAPFTNAPAAGAQFSAAITYLPANELPSVSLFDYWSPSTAVQRTLIGAAIDKLAVNINSDYHEFEFSGIAKDIIDSASFASGEGGLTAGFPVEPATGNADLSVVPGNMGQAWLGAEPQQFLTVTSATVQLINGIETRSKEFGSALPLGVAPGGRKVSMDLSLFQKDDAATGELYQAARQRSPISVMLQLGMATGQLFGIYMKSVVPELPEFDDSDKRLQWKFQKSRAQGTSDDEIAVAFA